jgi:hypothetical protein
LHVNVHRFIAVEAVKENPVGARNILDRRHQRRLYNTCGLVEDPDLGGRGFPEGTCGSRRRNIAPTPLAWDNLAGDNLGLDKSETIGYNCWVGEGVSMFFPWSPAVFFSPRPLFCKAHHVDRCGRASTAGRIGWGRQLSVDMLRLFQTAEALSRSGAL